MPSDAKKKQAQKKKDQAKARQGAVKKPADSKPEENGVPKQNGSTNGKAPEEMTPEGILILNDYFCVP